MQRHPQSKWMKDPIKRVPVQIVNSPENYIYSVLLSFIPAASIYLLALLIDNFTHANEIGILSYLLIIYSVFIIGNITSFISLYSIMDFKIYWRSTLLTNTFVLGAMIARQEMFLEAVSFGYYLMCLSFFHLGEFVTTALYNQSEVSTDSFLINHSWEYGMAMLVSWIEYGIELMLFPSLKTNLYIRLLGLFLVIFGEFFRKLAMYTAGTNFNHYVQESRKDGHILVKTGVYSFVRHPSYFGWFYWSIGTQVLLGNPICMILYAISTWKFFNSRITYEEFHLLRFFDKEYSTYQQKVSTGIPFIHGYVHNDESLD